jgi:hypothetical protein
MNFPMEQPIFQFFYWLVNTPGVGSVFVGLVGICSVTVYFLIIRSIRTARDEGVTYTYPTPAQHQREE